MIEIFLEGLEFYGYHGVPDAERQVGHRYKVDLSLLVDSRAEETNDVNDTADYGKLGVALVNFGESNQYKTLEKLSHEMAQHVLDMSPSVKQVRITIRKMLPPAPFIALASGVTLELRR